MRARFCLLLSSLVVTQLAAVAQHQHVELGVFGSYGHFDVSPFPHDAVGLGGRFDVNFTPYLVLEGEASYDFKHPRVEIVRNGISTFTVSTLRLGIVHGNAGVRVQTKSGNYFFFVKGGALNFRPEADNTFLIGPLITTQRTIQTDFTKGVFYPGGGIGFHAGILGIRVDAGDEIYWSNGAHNNIRITFGPTIRF
jgi:hypothetical protein